VKLGLVDDPPAAGAAAPVVEGTTQVHSEHRSGERVGRRRPRAAVQLAVDDLGHLLVRDLEQVFVRGPGLVDS
jgi:hypothetical protein